MKLYIEKKEQVRSTAQKQPYTWAFKNIEFEITFVHSLYFGEQIKIIVFAFYIDNEFASIMLEIGWGDNLPINT